MKSIAALSGRRVGPDHDASFPESNEDRVRRDLRRLFSDRNVERLICSAACGADIIALEVAKEMKIVREIVLPWQPSDFRRTSVDDCGASWSARFATLLSKTRGQIGLTVLGLPLAGEDPFRQTCDAILRETLSASASKANAIAIAVWDGRAHRGSDTTAYFIDKATQLGMRTYQVLTV